jgi:peptide/nickel transport system substrate-binding protein
VRRLAALSAALALIACFERGSSERSPAVAPEPAVAAQRAPSAAAEAGATLDPDATIRVALEAEPPHLNPLLAGDAIANRVAMGDLYEGLLCVDGPGAEARACLAARYQVDREGREWRFTLRDDVRFHDGQPFTAADVAFTYGILRRGSPPSWLGAELDDLEQVTVTGDHAVTLRFARSRPGRAETLARVPILPAHVFAGDAAELATHPGNRAPVGTGPLRLTSWTPGERIVLTRFDRYWGRPAAARVIEYHLVGSRQQALAQLAAGNLDLVIQVPVGEAETIEADPEVRSFSYSLPAYLAAVYNLRRKPLDQVEVRRALGLLMDRPGISRELFAGEAPLISGPMQLGTEAYDGEVAPLPFDRAAAARLLGEPAPALKVLVPSESRTMRRIADIWAADALPAARLAIEPLPYADLLARVREGRFDIALLAFTTGRDVDLFGRFHSSMRGAENYGAVADAELDRLLERIRERPDGASRAATSRALHRRLHALQPYAFIVGDVRRGLARHDIRGLQAPGHGLRARFLGRITLTPEAQRR